MDKRLNVLVAGAGAIGCFVGGRLAAAGHQVTLVGRPALMEKIARDGLKLCQPGQPPQTVSPETISSFAGPVKLYDFILVTVKAPDTREIAEQLWRSPLPLANCCIVSLQNGIGNETVLAETFSAQKVIAGTITIPISVPEQGMIEVSKDKGGIGLASLQPGKSGQPDQPVKTLAKALNEAGIMTVIYGNYRRMKWSKLLLNIVNNATSAILNQPPAEIIGCSELFNLEIEALQEGVAVMKAQGIEVVRLPGYSVDWLAWLVTNKRLPPILKRAILRPFVLSGRGTKMPSLQIDLAAGRRSSEIDVLNGAIVKAGRETGVSTPVNGALTEILSCLVSGEAAWADYQNQPEKLLAAVAARR